MAHHVTVWMFTECNAVSEMKCEADISAADAIVLRAGAPLCTYLPVIYVLFSCHSRISRLTSGYPFEYYFLLLAFFSIRKSARDGRIFPEVHILIHFHTPAFVHIHVYSPERDFMGQNRQ